MDLLTQSSNRSRIREEILSRVTAEHIEGFKSDGVIQLKQILSKEWLMLLELGIKRNLANPGPEACTIYADSPERSFYDDKMNYGVVPEYQRLLQGSPLVEVAAKVMGSENIWLYYDQIFIKGGGLGRRTPWHQDIQRLITRGNHMASLWMSLDPLSKEEALEFVAGSHRGPIYGSPKLDANNDTTLLDADEGSYQPIPNIEGERDKWNIVSWPSEPGDILMFHPGTLHGGGAARPGNRRRAYAVRFFGDDAVYSPTSGFYDGHALVMFPGSSEIFTPGEPLRHPGWFPQLRGRSPF
jgi:ectoine hydroxylase-related dioxygenase (phytanoyl-CoA dioxygenase family)